MVKLREFTRTLLSKMNVDPVDVVLILIAVTAVLIYLR